MTEKTTYSTIVKAENNVKMKSPKNTTIMFLRQFARVYNVLPGIAAASLIAN